MRWIFLFFVVTTAAMAQNRVVALMDRNVSVYEMMLREGCDPGWFYQVLQDSRLSTDVKQIEEGALKRVAVGREIVFPLPCSDPPPAAMAAKSRPLLSANQKAVRTRSVSPPSSKKAADKKDQKIEDKALPAEPVVDQATPSQLSILKNFLLNRRFWIPLLILTLVALVVASAVSIAKRRK